MSKYKIQSELTRQLSLRQREFLRASVLPQLAREGSHLVEAVIANDYESREMVEMMRSRFSVVQQGDSLVVETEGAASDFDRGFGPFDMKEHLLQSPKVKTADDGSRYLDVPVGSDDDKVNKGSILGNLDPGTDMEARLMMGPQSSFHTRPSRSRGGGYGAGTIRRVSENSPAGSWIHPGRQRRDYSKKLSKHLERKLAAAMEKVFRRGK